MYPGWKGSYITDFIHRRYYYVDNPMTFSKKQLKLISKLSKGIGYKMNS